MKTTGAPDSVNSKCEAAALSAPVKTGDQSGVPSGIVPSMKPAVKAARVGSYWTNEYMHWIENVPDDLASNNVAEVDVSDKYIDAVDLERRMWKDRVRLKRIKERTNKTGSQQNCGEQ
ncbi:Uncharacterized protein Rs2_05743 [Raphanus sativus]|nr:Uncharacterized protein Rs2_05743 [Raphanus sativus]